MPWSYAMVLPVVLNVICLGDSMELTICLYIKNDFFYIGNLKTLFIFFVTLMFLISKVCKKSHIIGTELFLLASSPLIFEH